jgi:Zn-finger nucleic acid-binding protein
VKCPKCDAELEAAVRHHVHVNRCPACHGMWIHQQDLAQLEDEVFDLDEHAKGTLIFNPQASALHCPECGEGLKRFNYRFYDLELEFCENGHGYWLDEGEDDRVLELMKTEEKAIDRSQNAEAKWTATLRRMHSSSFLDKIRDLLG